MIHNDKGASGRSVGGSVTMYSTVVRQATGMSGRVLRTKGGLGVVTERKTKCSGLS